MSLFKKIFSKEKKKTLTRDWKNPKPVFLIK